MSKILKSGLSLRQRFRLNGRAVAILFLVGFFGALNSALAGGKLILINGGSCAGKSTASKEILKQMSLKEPGVWQHLSVDELFSGGFQDKKMTAKERAEVEKLPILGQIAQKLHHLVKEKLDRNINVVLDHCMMADEIFMDALFFLRNEEVFFVKIANSYQSGCQRLEKRNQGADEGQHRMPRSFVFHHDRGSVVGKKIDGRTFNAEDKCFQGYSTHHNKKYDLEIDSSDLSPEAIAAQVVEQFSRAQLKPGQFFEAHRHDWDNGDHLHAEWEKSEQPHGCVYVQRQPKRFSDLYGNLIKIVQFGL